MKLTAKQKKEISIIGKKYNLRFIIIHGSYAVGEEKKGSDLDVANYGKNEIDFEKQLQIHGDIGRVFGDNKDRELDLKTLHGKDPLFVYQVVKSGQLIYGDKYDYSFFEAFAMRSYLKNNKIFRLEDILINKALQNI